MNDQTTTTAIPNRPTQPVGKGPLWRVESQVQRTGFTHKWAGYASDARQARALAINAARLDWPGFSFCVRSVVQVA